MSFNTDDGSFEESNENGLEKWRLHTAFDAVGAMVEWMELYGFMAKTRQGLKRILIFARGLLAISWLA